MNIRFYTLVLIVLAVSLCRILPHPPNFTPVMAVALFAGAYLQNRITAFLVPICAMLVADLFLGFHATMLFVYGGVALSVVLGITLRSNQKISRLFLTTVAASVAFFLITNFGAWLMMPEFYARNWSGLMTAYIAAIPFYQNSLLGDVFYVAILFGGFYLAQKSFPNLRQQTV